MDVFSSIYRHNLWNGTDSRSGPGSGREATSQVAEAIVALVIDLGVKSVLDAACGDGYWMPKLPRYLGIDVAPEAIRLAQKRNPTRMYLVRDVRDLRDEPRELVIFRDAIQHLPLADGQAALEAIRALGSRWLLASTFEGGANVDILPGDAYSPDLTAEPFSLGEPDRLIFDGYGYDDGHAVRDPRKFLGLWRL